MNENRDSKLVERAGTDARNYTFLMYLARLGPWRGFIIRNVFIVTVMAVVVSLLLPKWYKSTATVLPPKEEGMLGGLSGLTSMLREFAPVRGASTLGMTRGAYSYLSILNSREAMEMAIKKFDLTAVYGIKDNSMEKAVKKFSENYNVTVEDQGHISITVYDRDPQRAADIANYMVQVLNDINIRLNTKESGENRAFLERRVAESRDTLKKAEEALKAFQEKYGAYIATLPEAQMRYMQLSRDVYIQSKIIEVLTPILEQVRMQEKRDTPAVVQLDVAVPAERKAKPKRMIIVLSAAVSSLLLSLLYISLVEHWRRFQRENPEKYAEFLISYSKKRKASLQKVEK